MLDNYNISFSLDINTTNTSILRQTYVQDIGTTLWSFATVEYFDEAVFKVAASELTLSKSPSFKPQELSNTVWALATAGVVPQYPQAFDSTTIKNAHRVSRNEIISDPITACFAAATTELIRRPDEFKEQEIKDVLWSLSKVQPDSIVLIITTYNMLTHYTEFFRFLIILFIGRYATSCCIQKSR